MLKALLVKLENIQEQMGKVTRKMKILRGKKKKKKPKGNKKDKKKENKNRKTPTIFQK